MIGTVAVGPNPVAVAVNPVTNKIYVANCLPSVARHPGTRGFVTVIDGRTNSTTEIPAGVCPTAIAVNPITNKVYVANYGKTDLYCGSCFDFGSVTVIDGATNSAYTLVDPKAKFPHAVAVNVGTNRIYVANDASGNVTVIAGATNSLTTVPLPSQPSRGQTHPYDIVVNPATNQIYVTSFLRYALGKDTAIAVIDGATNMATGIVEPGTAAPLAVAVNSVTNKIYVANAGSPQNPQIAGTATVIDGATRRAINIPDPGAFAPHAIVVNALDNRIYVANANDAAISGNGGVTVVDGVTNSIIRVTDPNASTTCNAFDTRNIAVDTVRLRVYVANGCSSNVTVIDELTKSTRTVTDLRAVRPVAVDVNPVTGRIYVVNSHSNNVTVIDGTRKNKDAAVLAVAPVTLNFAVVRSGSTIGSSTPPQRLTLRQYGPGTVSWMATTDVAWLSLDATAGLGPRLLSASISSVARTLAAGTYVGHLAIRSNGSTDPDIVQVRLTVINAGAQRPPQGFIDTPVNGQRGLVGTMGMTGWAVDDVGIQRVRILRAPVAGEGSNLIYIGDAAFVDGARPDVAALFADKPMSTRAGWGFGILTNMLPRGGNGSYVLYAYADDIDGHSLALGSKTISCDNAHSMLPFGTIDTPSQGGLVTASPYVNFGWALAGQPASSGLYIPFDGHTIEAFVDSVSIGTLDTYNNARADIQRLFPGYLNTNGAVGAKLIDITRLANGLHSLYWVVTDAVGHKQPIGSRFFEVFRPEGLYLSLPATPLSGSPPSVSQSRAISESGVSAAADTGTIVQTRGWGDTPTLEFLVQDASGDFVTVVTVGNRLTLDLNPTHDALRFTGAEVINGVVRPLPMGSSLTPTGQFAWAPIHGFGGAHRLIFWAHGAGRITELSVRVDVRPSVAAVTIH